MASPDSELRLEQQRAPEGSRIAVARHDGFSDFYRDFYRNITQALYLDTAQQETYDGKHLPIGFSNIHVDGADFYAVLERNGYQTPDCVIAPVWFAPPLDKTLYYISKMANAFTQSSSATESPFTKRFIALFPYAELRQDKNTPPDKRRLEYWEEEARESIDAQILANTLAANGVTEAIILEPHSYEAVSFFESAGINTLCITAAPIFADWLIDKDYVHPHSTTVGLDEGSAQKNIHLAKILARKTGFPIKTCVLRKQRSGHSEISSQDLIYGDPKDSPTAIPFDDLVASGESILTTGKALKKYGCSQIIPCITHPVLAGKYARYIGNAARSGLIPAFAVTNSLPRSSIAEFMPIKLKVLPVETMLAFFAREVAIRSIDEVKTDPRYSDFILTPRPKDQVIASLCL